ncbi:MAG: recombinase family protein [Pyrinomonadaceae bacterium]|nr:recombinase family protein [Pyrinomonadaceae bacterium]
MNVASGAKTRPKREELLKLARQRKIDCILVWRLDRFGRSLADLITTLDELNSLGVSFVSLNESLDLTTPSGKALAGMLAVFAEFEREILRERVKAGIAEARSKGRPHGRPKTAAVKKDEIQNLHRKGLNNSEIARELKIGRSSVIRELNKSAMQK